MKRKTLIVAAIALGVLALVVIAIWPAAPLWARLGANPVCIQGDLLHLRLVPCQPIEVSAKAATPVPLPTPEGEAPIPLIFDDDGSPDGVIALLFFLRNPLYSVEAVTVSPGEAHPALFAQHVAQLLAAVGRPDIPVGVGRETPLEGNNAFPEPWRQASDAFWGIDLPEATDPAESHAAPQLIVETLNGSSHPVAIFVSGTHTNLAEALRLEPSIRGHIREVLVMGGSAYVEGNIESDWPAIHNRVAEWNIWVDPIAAREVFSSDLPLHVVPLDGTNRVTWIEADARDWVAAGSAEGTLAAQLLRWMLRSWAPDGVHVWDLVAAVVTTDSRLCPEVALALDVIVTPGIEQGRTVVEDQSPNAQVCLTPDAPQVKERATAMFAR
jgi:purine nucleosidase/pyrimidine-specific ribonucleoside hydrolase